MNEKLHLGCGSNYFDGYVNIDYPQENHEVMTIRPDISANIVELSFPENSIEEIRSHHVFEHFNRVRALNLIVRWHQWLKIDGLLWIETPDLEGCAEIFLDPSASPSVKNGISRCLAGDQASFWGYHIDHWYKERFERTLTMLGFSIERINRWVSPPYLANIEVIARKREQRSLPEQIQYCCELLKDSMVNPSEQKTHLVWEKQLRSLFDGKNLDFDAKKML